MSPLKPLPPQPKPQLSGPKRLLQRPLPLSLRKHLSRRNLMPLLRLLHQTRLPLPSPLLRPLTLRHLRRPATKADLSLILSLQGGRFPAPAFVMSKGAPC